LTITPTNDTRGGTKLQGRSLWVAAYALFAAAVGSGCILLTAAVVEISAPRPAGKQTTEGFILIHRGDCDVAKSAFDQALKSDPNDAAAYYGRAVVDACLEQDAAAYQ